MLERTGHSQPCFHIFDREIIETLHLGMKEGKEALLAVLESPKSSFSQKEGAVYGLGCIASSDLCEYFTLVWQRESGSDEFPVRRECVNAIIYSGKPEEISKFLSEKLESERESYSPKQRLFWNGSSNRNPDILRLLLGATYCPIMDEKLVSAVQAWLEVEGPKGPEYAALRLPCNSRTWVKRK